MGITASIDISAEQRRILLSLLKKYLPNTQVWAFGSRVKWTTRSNSDLDLVAFTNPQQDHQISALKEAFEESNLPFRVDLLVWDKLPENFKRNIQERYEVLVETNDLERGWVMSSDWLDMELGQFIELKRGYDLPKNNRETGSVPLVSSSGESDFHSVAKVLGPGVVTGRYGTIGIVFYIEEDFWPLNTTLYVQDFKGNDPLFVYYFLKTISYSDYSDKAAVPGINRNHLHKAQIRVPIDPSYQRELAQILWDFDKKIELNRQTNQTLEQIAQALFKSWFVDFEPVKAKIAALNSLSPRERVGVRGQELAERAAMSAISGKTPEQLAQLDPQTLQQLKITAALFPDALVDSELGEIPEGWEVQTVEDAIELAYGKALNKTVRIDGEFPVYGSGGLTGMHNQYLVDGPGIIVGRKGTVGSLFWEDKSFYPIDTVFYVKCKNDMPLEFSYYLLQVLGLEDMNTDAAVPGLNRNNVYRLELPKYPKVLVDEYTTIIRNIRHKIRLVNDEVSTLVTIRDSLLPKLLSGELSINPESTPLQEAI